MNRSELTRELSALRAVAAVAADLYQTAAVVQHGPYTTATVDAELLESPRVRLADWKATPTAPPAP